jgi:hypothetical protein
MSQKSHFIVMWIEIVESRVSPYTIVKSHDVAKDFGSSVLIGRKDMIRTFAFERCPEALDWGIVEAIVGATHADGYAVISQHLPVS